MIFVKVQAPRSKDPEELRHLVRGSRIEPSVRAAIAYAQAHAPAEMSVLICGSLYLIGEARAALQ
jgi:folylpolyglutamate synthase/dihydropteroate synthase